MTVFNEDKANELGSFIASKNPGQLLNVRTFTAFYGRRPDEVVELWEMCGDRITPRTKPDHLFWTLMYMKLYNSIDVMCVMLNTTRNTLDKWIWKWIEAFAMRHVDIIIWEKRYRNCPPNVWSRVTIDGTDFQICEPTPFNKKWKSPKNNGASVKYEVAVSIYSGDIVWISGPYRGGKDDTSIFMERLRKKLDEGEMVEADEGYKGNKEYIRSRKDYLDKKEKDEKSEIRARHETVNRRFKEWGILKQFFRSSPEKHQYLFFAIAVLTQIRIDNGDVLFSCEPTTGKESWYCI